MLAANGTSTPLVEADGSRLPFADGAFDGLVCGYALRNFTDLAATLAECARVLRAGGRLAVLEVDAPTSRLWRAGYDVWFNKAVPVAGRAPSRTGRPTATCRGRWPTFPGRRSCAGCCSTPASRPSASGPWRAASASSSWPPSAGAP